MEKLGKKRKLIPSTAQKHQAEHPHEHSCKQLNLVILKDRNM